MGLMRLVRFGREKWIWVYLGLIGLGGVLFLYGLFSVLGSFSFLDLPRWYSDSLAVVDEFLVVVGAILMALGLFWLKKNWSKFHPSTNH